MCLVFALLASCNGNTQTVDSVADSTTSSTYEYTVTNEAEFLAALDSAVAGTNTVITVADSIIFTGSGTSVSGSDGSSYVYLIEIPENYNILINFADDSYYLSVEAYANTVDSTTSSFKGNDTSDYRTLFYVNGGSLGINGGIVGGTLDENPLSRAVLVDAGGVFASNETTFRTYSNNFGSTICVLSGTGYIYDSKIYTTNRGLTINGSEASATLDGGTIISSVATYKTNSYLNAYGSYCVMTTEGKLYSYDATILAPRGGFSTDGGQTYLYEGTNAYVGTKYVTSTDDDENMLADQKTWYNQWSSGTENMRNVIDANSGSYLYIDGGTFTSLSSFATLDLAGTATISGGTFTAESSARCVYSNGTTTISGGTFTNNATFPTITVQTGTTTITGGTFINKGTGGLSSVTSGTLIDNNNLVTSSS